MHKKELIEKLVSFANNPPKDRAVFRGQQSFAVYFAFYLENLEIPSDEKYDFWDITPYLHDLAVDAFEQLRKSDNHQIAQFREQYEKDVGHKVPNIIDLGESDILVRSSAVQTTLGFLLQFLTGQNHVEHKIDSYCNAQQYVLQQTFDKFLRKVYRRGLYRLISDCSERNMSGNFLEVSLRTSTMAGRIMFTFAKRIDKSKGSYYKDGENLICNEHSVSFVGEDDDPLCLSAGIQSVYADFYTALSLIESVIDMWPEDPKNQKAVFKVDSSISIGF